MSFHSGIQDAVGEVSCDRTEYANGDDDDGTAEQDRDVTRFDGPSNTEPNPSMPNSCSTTKTVSKSNASASVNSIETTGIAALRMTCFPIRSRFAPLARTSRTNSADAISVA